MINSEHYKYELESYLNSDRKLTDYEVALLNSYIKFLEKENDTELV